MVFFFSNFLGTTSAIFSAIFHTLHSLLIKDNQYPVTQFSGRVKRIGSLCHQ